MRPYLFLLLISCIPFFIYGQPTTSSFSLETLDSLYNLSYQEGNVEELYDYAKLILTKSEQRFSKKDTAMADAFFKFGEANSMLYKLDEADTYYQRAADVYQKANLSIKYAACLDGLGTMRFYKGDYLKVEAYWRESLQIKSENLGSKHPDCASILNALAVLYNAMGYYEEQEEVLLEALAIRKEALGEDSRDYITTLKNLAVVYHNLQDYNKAETFYQESLTRIKKTSGENSLEYSRASIDLGTLYKSVKKYKLAEEYLLKGVELQRLIGGEENPEYAIALIFLGNLLFEKEDYQTAETKFLQSAEIRKKIFGTKHPDYGESLNNLALVARKQKEFLKAEKLLLKVLEIDEQTVGRESAHYSNTSNNLAALYMDMGNDTAARAIIADAIYANSKLKLDQNINENWRRKLAKAEYRSLPKMIESLEHLYNLLNRTSTEASAEAKANVADLAIALLERVKNEFNTESSKLRALAKNADWVVRNIETKNTIKYLERNFQLAEQNKAVLLLESAQAERAYHFGNLPDSLIQLETELLTAKSELKVKIAESQTEESLDQNRRELNAIMLQIDAFNDKLEEEYPEYKSLKYAQSKLELKSLQEQLGGQTALIEYVVTDSVIYIFYISKDEATLKRQLMVDTRILSKQVKQLHKVVSDYDYLRNHPQKAEETYLETASWMYQELLAPVLKDSEEIDHLIIVADGILAHLPFEIFLTQAPKTPSNWSDMPYLLKDYSISYNYSAALWLKNKEGVKIKNNGKVLAFAASYEGGLSASSTRRLPVYSRLRQALQALPAAKEEVEALEQLYIGDFIFGKAASEANFKRNAKDYAVIHLAMHGMLNEKRPLLSSLAFTENGDTLENNFLQAYEISKMKLNANLVVLSACETGYGRFEKGNGTASLARAFMYAGIPSLVVSLWQVNDEATSIMMQLFYARLADGMSKAEALQQAKLSYLESVDGFGAYPAFWSPFILIGDESAVNLQCKGGTPWGWIAGGSIALLVCLGGLGIRNKKRAA